MGVATQAELDAVKKRVRHLERTAGMTASGARRKTAARRKPAGAKASTAKSTAKGTSPRTTNQASTD
jgi:hypothetical protein